MRRIDVLMRAVRDVVPFVLGVAMVAHEAFDNRPGSDPAVIAAGLALIGTAGGLRARDILKPIADTLRYPLPSKDDDTKEGGK